MVLHVFFTNEMTRVNTMHVGHVWQLEVKKLILEFNSFIDIKYDNRAEGYATGSALVLSEFSILNWTSLEDLYIS